MYPVVQRRVGCYFIAILVANDEGGQLMIQLKLNEELTCGIYGFGSIEDAHFIVVQKDFHDIIF